GCLGGQRTAYRVAASAGHLLFRDTASVWEIGVQRQMPRAFGAGAGMDVDLPWRERFAAFGAHHDRIEILAADIVSVQQRTPFLFSHVDIAPVDDRHDYREEVEPLLSQAILITPRPLLVGHFDEHKLVDE